MYPATPPSISLLWRDDYASSSNESTTSRPSDDADANGRAASHQFPDLDLDLANTHLAAMPQPSVSQQAEPGDQQQHHKQFRPRGYQLELFNRAAQENIIACVETGAGKTLISGLLIKHILNHIAAKQQKQQQQPETERKEKQPNQKLTHNHLDDIQRDVPAVIVFLVHRVALVQQQASVIQNFLGDDFVVGCYHGEKGVDNWSTERWTNNIVSHHVLVMTAQVFLNLLRHGLVAMSNLALLIVDEAHHATKNHPYRRIFIEFYHASAHKPRVFGMTATPVKTKTDSNKHSNCLNAIAALEATMDSTVVTVSLAGQSEIECLIPKPDEYVVLYYPLVANNPPDIANTNRNNNGNNRNSSSKSSSNSSNGSDALTIQEDRIDKEILNNLLLTMAPDRQPQLASNLLANAHMYHNGSDGNSSEPNSQGKLPANEFDLLVRLNYKLGFLAAKDIAERFCKVRKINPDYTVNTLLKLCTTLDFVTAGVRDKVIRLFDVIFQEYMKCKSEREQRQHEDKSPMECDNGENPGGASNNENKDKGDDKFRTIIFTHERVTALALSNLINDVFGGHNLSELTSKPIVSSTSLSSSSSASNQYHQHGGIQSIMKMSNSLLQASIDEFRRGDFGIIVATNVIEEGIDVPSCRLVITFDPPLSPSAYVQGRGRARRANSKYVSLVSYTLHPEFPALARSRTGAQIMLDVSKGSHITEQERKEKRLAIVQSLANASDIVREKTLFSSVTTARITATDAVNLLDRYVAVQNAVLTARRGVKVTLQEPTYDVRSVGRLFIATVRLDPVIQIDAGFCMDPQVTQQLAKRHAALDAYRKLYEIGEVDDYLLPKKGRRTRRVLQVEHGDEDDGEFDDGCDRPGPIKKASDLGYANNNAGGGRKGKKKKSRLPVEPKSAKKCRRIRQCEIEHPLQPIPFNASPTSINESCCDPASSPGSTDADQPSCQGTDVNGDGDVSMAERGNPQDGDKENRNSTNKNSAFHHTEQNGGSRSEEDTLTMVVYKIQMIDDTENEIDSLKSRSDDPEERTNERLLGIVLHDRMPTEDLNACKCPSGKPLLLLSEVNEIPWTRAQNEKAYHFVLSIQICLLGKTPGSLAYEALLEQQCTDTRFVKPMFYLLPLMYNGNKLDINWHAIDKVLNFGWRTGPLQQHEAQQALARRLVCSNHEGLERVYISDRASGALQLSSSCTGYLSPTFSTFREYYEEKHEVTFNEAAGDEQLLPGYSLRETLSQSNTSVFMLVPQLLRVVPLDPYICYVASVLPYWQTFLVLRKCWARSGVRPVLFIDYARALQPNVNNVCDGNADLCYERVEFLGDSVLKVVNSLVHFVRRPHDDEGTLSDERDIEVSNGFLADAAKRMCLHYCLAYSGIAPKVKSWPWYWGAHSGAPLRISEKVLADCVEALIGSHYQGAGFPAAVKFLDRHGLVPGACAALGVPDDADGCSNTNADAGFVEPPVLREDTRASDAAARLATVEQQIGYTFNDRRHLVVALTHGSWDNGRAVSYQKYEYLGDAVVGFILLSHFHASYPHLGPYELTKLRGPALSNNLFARAILRLGLHTALWHRVPGLDTEIDEVMRALRNEEAEDEGDICERIKVPKILGDILEAIFGAIVVDQRMQMGDSLKHILLRVLEPELERFANPYRFKDNIVSHLILRVQKKFQTSPVYTFLDKPDDDIKRCEVWVGTQRLGEGTGPTRPIARRIATSAALESLGVDTGCKVLGEQSLRQVGGKVRGGGVGEGDADGKAVAVDGSAATDGRTLMQYDDDI